MSQKTRTHTRSDVSKCVSVCSGGGERREAAAQKPIWRRLLCDSGPRSAAPDEQATGRNTKETGRHTRRLLSSWPGASTQRNHPPGCPASAYTHTHIRASIFRWQRNVRRPKKEQDTGEPIIRIDRVPSARSFISRRQSHGANLIFQK